MLLLFSGLWSAGSVVVVCSIVDATVFHSPVLGGGGGASYMNPSKALEKAASTSLAMAACWVKVGTEDCGRQ